MYQFRPIGLVLSVSMLIAGAYMIYDAATDPRPNTTVALIGGAVFLTLGAFMAYFSSRRTMYEKDLAAAGLTRSGWRLRMVPRRGRAN